MNVQKNSKQNFPKQVRVGAGGSKPVRRISGDSYILVGTGFPKSVSQLVTLSEFDREYKIILTKYVGQMFCHVHFTHYVTSIATCWDIMQYIICSRTALVSNYTLQFLCLRTAPCQLESVEPRKRLLCTYIKFSIKIVEKPVYPQNKMEYIMSLLLRMHFPS